MYLRTVLHLAGLLCILRTLSAGVAFLASTAVLLRGSTYILTLLRTPTFFAKPAAGVAFLASPRQSDK